MDASINIDATDKAVTDEACWAVLDKILFAMRILGNLRKDLTEDNFYGFVFNDEGTVSAILSRFQETCGYTAAVHSRLFFPTARTNNSIASTLAAHGNIFFGQEPLAADRRIIIQLNGDTTSKIPFAQLRASVKPRKPHTKSAKSASSNTSSSSAANTSSDAAAIAVDEIVLNNESAKRSSTKIASANNAADNNYTSVSVSAAIDAATNSSGKDAKNPYRSLVGTYEHYMQAYDEEERKYIFNRYLSLEGKKDDFLVCKSPNGRFMHWMRLSTTVAEKLPYESFCKNLSTKQIAKFFDVIGTSDQQGAEYFVRHVMSIPMFRDSALQGVRDAGLLVRGQFSPEETDYLMINCKLNWPQLRSLNAILKELFKWPVLSSERSVRDLRNQMLMDEARAKLRAEGSINMTNDDFHDPNDLYVNNAALPCSHPPDESDAIEAMSQLPVVEWS